MFYRLLVINSAVICKLPGDKAEQAEITFFTLVDLNNLVFVSTTRGMQSKHNHKANNNK